MPPLPFIHRLPTLAQMFPAAQPAVAAEITDEHVAFARAGRGSPPALASWFVARLPAGAVRPSPSATNIAAPDDVATALRMARERVSRGGPISLVLPDILLRLALVPLDAVPLRREETRELVAWRLKRTLPFRVEEAALDWQVFPATTGKPMLLAVAARQRIVAEYEHAFEAQGFEVGSVTASTLALADMLPACSGDQMLLNVSSGWFSVLILRGGLPLFYRCKLLPGSERGAVERSWFIAGEIQPTLEYHRTRLAGTTLERAHVHVSGPGADALMDTLGTSLESPLEMLTPPSAGLPLEAAERLGPAHALACRGVTGDAGRRPAKGATA